MILLPNVHSLIKNVYRPHKGLSGWFFKETEIRRRCWALNDDHFLKLKYGQEFSGSDKNVEHCRALFIWMPVSFFLTIWLKFGLSDFNDGRRVHFDAISNSLMADILTAINISPKQWLSSIYVDVSVKSLSVFLQIPSYSAHVEFIQHLPAMSDKHI